MPLIDGFEATRQIRQAEGMATPPRHTPIIALTANALNGDRERCLEAGMDDYVSKPIDPDRLVKAIQMLLARSSPTSPTSLVIETSPVTATPLSRIASAEIPPLAVEAMLERCMGDSETVLLILNEFESQAIADLAEIKRHVANGDCEEIARVAHALKGASGILSAGALSDIAFKLERMGRAGVLAEGDQLLAQLNDEIRRCIDFLPTVRAAITTTTEG
jgi:Amt family ammonium transporter